MDLNFIIVLAVQFIYGLIAHLIYTQMLLILTRCTTRCPALPGTGSIMRVDCWGVLWSGMTGILWLCRWCSCCSGSGTASLVWGSRCRCWGLLLLATRSRRLTSCDAHVSCRSRLVPARLTRPVAKLTNIYSVSLCTHQLAPISKHALESTL